MRPVPVETRALALRLEDAGVGRADVCRELGVSRSSIARWRQRLEPVAAGQEPCWRCAEVPTAPPDATAYLYLLGQYLGDGHLAPVGRTSGTSQVLRIYGDDAWPGIQDEIASAMPRLLPVRVFRVQKPGCHSVEAVSAHWQCLLPQHGPGKKHNRRIMLTDWQHDLVSRDARPLVRGLLHSDGCRVTNRVVTRGTPYSYPRYFFTNLSEDILNLFTFCLDELAIPWRRPRPTVISVARREGVAALDAFVGPKY